LWKADPHEDDAFCAVIPPEPFRLYSIASAPPPGQPATTLQLVVAGLDYTSAQTPWSYPRKRQGTASHFLRRASAGGRHRLSLQIVSTPRFRLPADPARPVVMFAAGSGIAPFLGFVAARTGSDKRRLADPAQVPAHDERRLADPAQVPAHDERRLADPAQVPAHGERRLADPAQVPAHDENRLYLGIRTPEEVVARTELDAAAAAGRLKLSVAFSRADAAIGFDGRRHVVQAGQRRRVDDVIRAEADALWELLRSTDEGGGGAFVYVCGSA